MKLTPMKRLCVEMHSEYPNLGRFVVRDMGQTIAVDIIKKLEKFFFY